LFRFGTDFEENVIVPYLQDRTPEDIYVQNGIWIDCELTAGDSTVRERVTTSQATTSRLISRSTMHLLRPIGLSVRGIETIGFKRGDRLRAGVDAVDAADEFESTLAAVREELAIDDDSGMSHSQLVTGLGTGQSPQSTFKGRFNG
jgi:hypothetical protein